MGLIAGISLIFSGITGFISPLYRVHQRHSMGAFRTLFHSLYCISPAKHTSSFSFSVQIKMLLFIFSPPVFLHLKRQAMLDVPLLIPHIILFHFLSNSVIITDAQHYNMTPCYTRTNFTSEMHLLIHVSPNFPIILLISHHGHLTTLK